MADVSGGRSTPTPDERCPDCGTELTADDWCSYCQKDPRPPVGDTTAPAQPIRWWCCKTPLTGPHGSGCTYEPRENDGLYTNPVVVAQPQPTDDGHGKHCGGCRELALLTAVAEIRALHRRGMWTATEQFYCTHCRDKRGYTHTWPCPTIAILDEAGCP